MAMNLFSSGLPARSSNGLWLSRCSWSICRKILRLCEGLGRDAGGVTGTRPAMSRHLFLQLLAASSRCPIAGRSSSSFPSRDPSHYQVERARTRPTMRLIGDSPVIATERLLNSSTRRDVKRTPVHSSIPSTTTVLPRRLPDRLPIRKFLVTSIT